MLNQERKNKILEIIEEKGAVSVTELTKLLGASESTIRRDLIELSKKGNINKVHGGATLTNRQFIALEADVSAKETENISQKKKIARYCAQQLQDDDFVYIDAGTTTLFMIDHIDPDCSASFVTNGIIHAKRMADRGLNVYVLGGKLKKTTQAVVGLMAARSIHSFNFTKAFVGTNGVSDTGGFTTPDTEEAFVKAAAMENAFVSYVLADSSKFGKISSVRFAALDAACIVTDSAPEDIYMNKTVIKVLEQQNS